MMNRSIDELFFLSPRELDYLLSGYKTRVNQRWEQTRLIAFYAVAPHSKHIKKPTDIFRLPDEQNEVFNAEDLEGKVLDFSIFDN